MLFGFFPALLVAASPFTPFANSTPQLGVASYYYPKDGHCGKFRADGKRFLVTDEHVAHRKLPLGTPIIVENLKTGAWAVTRVRDRGPFGFCVQRSKKCRVPPNPTVRGGPCPKTHLWAIRVRRKKNECGYYRGIVDVTRPLA